MIVVSGESGVEAILERTGYTLHNEDVQVTEREVVSAVEATPADLGADVTEDSFVLETRSHS